MEPQKTMADSAGQETGWELYTPEQSSARLRTYLDMIWRRKKFFFLFVICGVVLTAAYTMIMPHTYVAEASLMPPEEPSRGGGSFAALLSTGGINLGSFGSNQSAKVFVAILQSRTLADSLIERLHLMERMDLPEGKQMAVKTLQQMLWVEDDKAGVVRLQFRVETSMMPGQKDIDSASHLAAEITNQAVDLLDLLNRQKIVTRASRSRDFLAEMKELKRSELDSARERMARFQKQNRAFALDEQIEASVSSLAQIQAQIQLKELEVARAERELNADGQVIENLRSELAELKKQRSGVAGTDVLGMKLDAAPDLAKEYTGLRLDLEVAAQVYTFLESQYSSEQVQAARDLPTVSVLDYAEPPPLRSSPKRGFIVMISVVVLCVLALGIILFMELFGQEFGGFMAERLPRVFGRKK